jgi:hypothetical protein
MKYIINFVFALILGFLTIKFTLCTIHYILTLEILKALVCGLFTYISIKGTVTRMKEF